MVDGDARGVSGIATDLSVSQKEFDPLDGGRLNTGWGIGRLLHPDAKDGV